MRRITAGELSKILKEHKKWIDTDTKEGKCANLSGAYLNGAKLRGAYLIGVNLSGANLKGVVDLDVEQISEVKTLYKAKLDPELIVQVKDRYPHLLKKPKPEK